VGAIDLASTNDIAAVVWEFRVGDRWHFVPRFFIPEDNMRERVRRDRVPYDAWVRDGLVIATPGDVIDYEFIRAQIIADAALFKPVEIAYDAWNATDTVTQLQGAGLNMVPCRQGFITMSPAMKALETEIISARVAHGGNPVLRWMLGNVSPQRDAAGNIKPDKARSREKIDGIVAMIMAHSRLMLTPEPKRSRYESEGPVVL
jgi:phage terminase large subunit-like protein